ncbi:aminotransferase class III-fold pyridoxal phosphate-dependent enzyme, partial [Pseudomonas amygdali]
MDDCRPSIVRGEGVYLYDDTGRRYIDGISGSYNHCLGHSHFGLIAAVKEQVDTLVHACNISSNTVLPEALAERISGKLVKARLVHTFLVMSGSEGVEAALKMAWQYQINRGCPQRTGQPA